MFSTQRALLTGGAGFIGHHLIDYLLKNTELEVVSLDRLDTSGNYNRLHEILKDHPGRKRLKVVWHDLKADLNEYVTNEIGEVNYVLHLAAASHVDRSILHPVQFVMDNVLGTANLLEYARKCDLSMFLYFGTDEVFGPAPEGTWFKEDDRYAAKNPYAATKAAAEELCMAYENTYKVPVVATHTMNIYGKRQHPEKYIPLLIKKILLGEKVEIHANSSLTAAGRRHYLHVDDLCEAVLFLLRQGRAGEKYNIVASEEFSNLELAEMVAKAMGRKLRYEMVDPKLTRPRFDFRYACDGSKMEKMGWTPKTKMRDALPDIIRWWQDNNQWLHIRR